MHLSEVITSSYTLTDDISSAITTAESVVHYRGDKKIKTGEDKKPDDKKDAGAKGGEKEAGGQAGSGATLDLHEDPFRIEPLLGYFSKDDP